MKSNLILIILGAVILFTACQQTAGTEETAEIVEADHTNAKKGNIKVTLLYPNGEGKTFDMDYYANKHMPMVARLLGESLTDLAIDKGVSGRTPDDPIPYLAIGYLYFDKLSDYRDSFGPVAQEIVGDIPNYTNVQPIVQISEILQ